MATKLTVKKIPAGRLGGVASSWDRPAGFSTTGKVGVGSALLPGVSRASTPTQTPAQLVAAMGGQSTAAAADAAGPAALPFNEAYAGSISQAHTTRANTETALRAQRARTLLDYGYAEGDDPEHTLSLDPNNPAGRAQALQRQWQQAKRGTLTTAAARGHLRSGSLVEQQNANTTNEAIGTTRLLQSAQGDLAGNSAAMNGAADTEGGTLAELLGRYAMGLTSDPNYHGA